MPDHVLLVLQKGYLENLIGTWLLVITIVQVNERDIYKRDMLNETHHSYLFQDCPVL